MQKSNMYSIYDVKAESYGVPFPAATDGLAVRLLAKIVEFGGNPDYQKYPEDFMLYVLGEFDDHSGLLTPCQPRLIASCLSVIQQSRGAAVGGESPLKQQSANPVVAVSDAESAIPACDDTKTTLSEAPNSEVCDA